MAAYEILLLNTAIPQIQAAQSGDTYLCPRELAVVVNTATDAVRITQTGTGNALLVEDSANPDSSPFVVTAAGDVGIGTTSPTSGFRLDVVGGDFRVSDVASDDGVEIGWSSGGNQGFVQAYDRNASAFRSLILNAAATIDSSGNLGLGVTPTAAYGGLQIVGPTSASLYTQQGIDVVRTGVRASGRTGIVFDSSDATYTNRMWYIANEGASGSLDIGRSGLSVLTMSNSGNLGLGVTPSASWNNIFKAIQIGSSSYLSVAAQNTAAARGSILWNAIGSGDESFVYRNTGDPANRFMVGSGFFAWYTAGNGTAGDPISFIQRMTLDASGNLVVGDTSAGSKFDVLGGNSSGSDWGNINITSRNVINATNRIYTALRIRDSGSSDAGAIGYSYNGTGYNMMFATVPSVGGAITERARITSGGYFKASDNGTYLSSTGTYHEFNSDDASNATLVVRSTSASFVANTLQLRVVRNTTNGTFFPLRYYNEGAGADKFLVADSGDVTNTNGSYGTISDAKMKTDIVDAGSQWSDIKALRFRKFKMKNDPSGLVQLGVVAQEVELTSPGLVDEHADKDAEGNDLGTTTKSVKTSVLLMKAAVALQEAMARIEKLEAEVAALKGA